MFLEGLLYTFLVCLIILFRFVQTLFGRIIQKGRGRMRALILQEFKISMIEGQGSIEVGRWSEFYIFIAFKIRIISNLIKELKHLYCVLIF